MGYYERSDKYAQNEIKYEQESQRLKDAGMSAPPSYHEAKKMREDFSKINKMTSEQKTKYVMEGS